MRSNPDLRPSADDCLKHAWLKDVDTGAGSNGNNDEDSDDEGEK